MTENRGKRTPGVDGETWNTPAQKWSAVHNLKQHGYRALPLRRVYIEKRDTTAMRPLGIPVMRDRAMQALYLLALSPIAETTGDEASYGFRPERSTADAIEQCFTLLAKRGSPQWILEGDIFACFDGISHDWLLEHVLMDRSILHQWLKAGFMDKSVLYPTQSGTPQGGVASPVLANLALDGLQKALRERFPKLPTGSTLHRVNMVRYADDFIVVADSQEVLADEVVPLVEAFLRERGLELSKRKTVITHIETGFDFLGQHLRKYDGKALTKPAKQRIQEFLRRVREITKGNLTIAAGELIRRLNPVIRGWANYHRHVVSKKTFASVDNQIWKALWQWARRRHPDKNLGWIKAKYFPAHGGRQWVFSGPVANSQGGKTMLRLFAASTVRIRRHVAIRGGANPFDPQWADYFRQRHLRRRKDAFIDRLRWQEAAQRGAVDEAFIRNHSTVEPRPHTKGG